MEEKSFYTYPEVAKIFSVTVMTVRRWVERGYLIPQMAGLRPKISHEQVQSFLNREK